MGHDENRFKSVTEPLDKYSPRRQIVWRVGCEGSNDADDDDDFDDDFEEEDDDAVDDEYS